jgi:hypothetical protein
MTKFSNENLIDSNGWLSYGPERKFVANFSKRGGGKATFIKFLIKNFTVEEYFEMYNSGMAPLRIVQTKGYLLPHIKTWLKRDGYEVSKAGFDKYVSDKYVQYAA